MKSENAWKPLVYLAVKTRSINHIAQFLHDKYNIDKTITVTRLTKLVIEKIKSQNISSRLRILH